MKTMPHRTRLWPRTLLIACWCAALLMLPMPGIAQDDMPHDTAMTSAASDDHGDDAAGRWGYAAVCLDHWCRDHDEMEKWNRFIHVQSQHQHMRFQTNVELMPINDDETMKVVKVDIELAHQDDGHVHFWTWGPGNTPDMTKLTTRSNAFRVRYGRSYKTLNDTAWDGRGLYSATTTVWVTSTKKGETGSYTRPFVATRTFCVIEMDMAIANTRSWVDDLVQIRDPVCRHNFYEDFHVWVKAPGAPQAVSGTVASVTNRAPFVAARGPSATTGGFAAPATMQAVRFNVPAGVADHGGNGIPKGASAHIIHGHRISAAYRDESYRFTVDQDPCENRGISATRATVFGFDGTLRLEPSATYAVTIKPGSANAGGEVSINLSNPNDRTKAGIDWRATAQFVPGGMPNDAPQLQHYHAGFVNNGASSAFTIRMSNPRVDPVDRVSGTQYPLEASAVRRYFPQTWDGLAEAFPVYARNKADDPPKGTGVIPWLKMTTANAVVITANDTPNDRLDPPFRLGFGRTVVWYDSVRWARAQTQFKLWLVAHRASDNLIIPIRQHSWQYNIRATGERLSADAANTNAMECPVLRLPNLNTEVNRQKYEFFNPSDAKGTVP